MVYMSSSFLQLAVGSRDLSQAEQIHTVTTIFTQNDNFLHPRPLCEFAQLCKQLFLSQLEINHVIQEPTEARQNTCRPPQTCILQWKSGTGLKVNKFQNEFMKSSFLPKYEPNIVRICALYCAKLQRRNPYNFWFIFWQKQ